MRIRRRILRPVKPWAYKVFWGSQSTSEPLIFGVRKPILDVKTAKTSVSASTDSTLIMMGVPSLKMGVPSFYISVEF